MSTIRVLVHGATGRMGREVITALWDVADMESVGGVCRQPRGDTLALPNGSGEIPLSTDLAYLLTSTRPHVVVDFTNAEASMAAAMKTLEHGIPFVTGSSGMGEEDLGILEQVAGERGVGVIVAPNFALGAVLLISLAERAATFFDYVDIIEAHHEGKIDSPSGTALALARAVAKHKEFTRNRPQRQTLPGTQGGEYRGVGIHSLRQPGRSAHHEVVFAATGQTLTLRHDALGRGCYMSGVVHAIREVVNLKGLVLGLDKILGL